MVNNGSRNFTWYIRNPHSRPNKTLWSCTVHANILPPWYILFLWYTLNFIPHVLDVRLFVSFYHTTTNCAFMLCLAAAAEALR